MAKVDVAAHIRAQVRRETLDEVQAIVDECTPHGQYERFDEHLLYRRLRELRDDVVPPGDTVTP